MMMHDMPGMLDASSLAIRLVDVSKKYMQYENEVHALKNVSVDVRQGECVAIVGASGSGKSTLLNIMGCLDRPTSGTVYIDGHDTNGVSGAEIALFRGKKIGFIFQNYNVIPRLSVLENVMLPGLIQKRKKSELRERALELLTTVGIAHRADHKSVHLSGGEQQRVAIARALINEPSIVFADEPTGALDHIASEEIMQLLAKVNTENNVTVVFVTHELSQAAYARRHIELRDGEIICDLSRERTATLQHPETERVDEIQPAVPTTPVTYKKPRRVSRATRPVRGARR